MLAPGTAAADPRREAGLVEVTGGEREHRHRAFDVVGKQQLASVQRGAQFHRDESGSLVAVGKRTILGKSEAIRSRQRRQFWLTVGRELLRPGQGGLEQRSIANTGQAAVLGKLLVMNRNYRGPRDPRPWRVRGPCHSASSIWVTFNAVMVASLEL